MSAVREGTYRFQNITSNDGSDYMTLKTTGLAQAAPLDENSDTQKWKVTKSADGHYDIANIGTGALLAIASPNMGETAYTLSAKGDKATSWDFDRSGSKVVLKPTGDFAGKAADLSEKNRIIVWDSNGLQNQCWILEFVAPLVVIQPTWVAVHGADIPDNAIVAGHEASDPALYIGRFSVEGSDITPGKAGKQLGNCRVAFRDDEKSSASYEVLIASPGTYKWVPIPDGNMNLATFPERFISGGKDPEYSAGMFIIRAPINGALIPGKACATYARITLNGAAMYATTGRELLCYV